MCDDGKSLKAIEQATGPEILDAVTQHEVIDFTPH
jgi:hypothetical protein